MEMMKGNLTKLFTWAVPARIGGPMADTAAEAILIDGACTKEDLDQFMASHLDPPDLPRSTERSERRLLSFLFTMKPHSRPSR
jgi:hypothetical protein